MGIFDLFDQATNTELVQRSVTEALNQQEPQRIARQLSTLVPTRRDKIKKRRMYVRAVGKGRFVAPDATPPIFRPKIRITEEEVELARLAEMSPVEESLLRQLQIDGSDEESQELRLRAGADILTRARALQLRNENQSDWMVMQALTNGVLPVEMADEPGQKYEVDYDFPPTHISTVTTPWSTSATATTVEDLRAAQLLLADDAGDIGIHFWMTSQIWRYLRNSKQVKDYLTPTNRPLYIAQEEDIKALLEDPERVTFHITDAGWLDEDAAGTGYPKYHDFGRGDFSKWLPEDRVIVTTDDPYNGERLIENFDGLVPVMADWNRMEYRPGMQSEVLVDGKPKVHWWLQESRRMVRVNRPENIISMKVLF